MSTDGRERRHAAPEPQSEDKDEHEEGARWGEVAHPLDSEGEAEAVGGAIRALRLPSHTSEQRAQLERLAEIAERNERHIADLIRLERTRRAKSAYNGKHDQQ